VTPLGWQEGIGARMRTLSIFAVSLVAIAAVTCGSSVAKVRPGQAPVASASANVPQSEIQEGLESLQATTVIYPGLTPVLFKPISTRALKALRPFLKNDPGLITDKRLADAAESEAAPLRLFVAQLRDESANHDLLFVMDGRESRGACTPSARRVGGSGPNGEGCSIQVYVDDGQISNWRTQKGIGGTPAILFVQTAGGPMFFLKASDGMSILYCDGVNPTEPWQWPLRYHKGQGENPVGYIPPSRLGKVRPDSPMQC
jgi:uncharacterized membrane protein